MKREDRIDALLAGAIAALVLVCYMLVLIAL